MQNTPKTLIALSLTLLLAPLPALAGDGFYVAASIGSASLDDDFDGLEVDDDTTAYRILVGWQANRYLALEAGYQNFGEFEQDFTINGVSGTAKLKADGYTFGLTGSYPILAQLDLQGRAGAYFWDGEAEVNRVSQASPEDTNAYFGLGLRYNFNDRFAVTGDWTRFDLESANSDVYAVGVLYRFGR